MKNIILIGMPGCGKSTIGVLLAKSLLLNFVDTDLIIQKKHSLSLCEIISSHGLEQFIEIENNIIAQSVFSSSVIATGGSAVYGEKAMANLKRDGIVIYLDVPLKDLCKRLNNIKTRGIAMKKGTTIEELYNERLPLYKKYADITINCRDLSAEECVDEIVKQL